MDRVLEAAFDIITLMIAFDEEVTIKNFGKFSPKEFKEATRPHPRTHEPLTTPPHKSMGFKPSPATRERLNGQG